MGNKKYCCGHQSRRISIDSFTSESSFDFSSGKKIWPLWKKVLVWSTVALLILILIAFILIWVVVPIVFWLSLGFQKTMTFFPFNVPKNPNFSHPETHGINGVRNFYIPVTDYHDAKVVTSIGAWLILPERDKASVTSEDVSQIITETDFDILVYNHGVAENRAKATSKYELLRKYFLVISVDHRGYGDSGEDVIMSEQGMINDHLQVYDWIANRSLRKNIYYWGHSLGAAISCHTVRALKEQRNVVPKGLVLESAFSTLAEEVTYSIFGKLYKWLPYFNQTVLNPLDYNGLQFYSTTHIQKVNCPIMMFHAEDDNVIPHFLGAKLADIAKTKRDPIKQGNVTFHLFPKGLGYGHNDITKDPMIPEFIVSFKDTCEAFSGGGV